MIPGSFPVLLAPASGGYVIEGSAVSSTAYLDKTLGTPTNAFKTTVEFVVKRATLGVQQEIIASTTPNAKIQFLSTDELWISRYVGGYQMQLVTTQKFRDPGAWLHIVFSYDVTVSSPGVNNVRLYVNGTQITSFSTTNYPSQNESWINNTSSHRLFARVGSGIFPQKGYVARVTLIDGQALTPTDFGELTDDGFWQINDVSGLTFGTNGFLIEGGTAMAAGTDSSGNSNSFTKSGTITATSDSPTDGGVDDEYGNLVTINPLEPKASGFTLSNGNKTYVSTGAQANMLATFGATSGKFYWEVNITALGAGTSQFSYGIAAETWDQSTTSFGPADTWYLNSNGSNSNYANSGTSVSGIAVAAAGDVMQIALDLDNQKLWFGNDDTWYTGEPDNGSTPAYTNLIAGERYIPFFGGHSAGTNMQATIVMDEDDWTYTVPTGFTSLNTANLPEPAVANYEDEYYIEAGISHSNGATTAVTLPKTVSGGAMVRLKRTNTTGGWYVFDTVRGANKFSYWDLYATEDTSTFDDQNLTGTTFTIPSDMASGTYLIEVFYVGVYFQIDLYNGNSATRTLTYDTALDTAPGMMVFFRRSGTAGSVNPAYHTSLGATKTIYTDLPNPAATISTVFNNTEPTTSGYTLGNNEHNKTSGVYVSYHWANSGPYAFGSYTGNGGNGNAGPFINVGGAPRSLFAKKTTSSSIGWIHHAGAYNDPVNANETDWYCAMNTTGAIGESTGTSGGVGGDFVSTGWKHRGGYTDMNASGVEIIYGAFGIQPVQGNGKDTAQGRSK